MNINTQHGRQPPPQQAAPPTDPRTDPRIRNPSAAAPAAASAAAASAAPATAPAAAPAAAPATLGDSQGGICRDFIWGICTMGAQCKYRHELEYDAMKAVLKFCHDHQNRTGCTRPDCTYLHTSREEENLFLTTGQIPRVLIDRYTGVPTEPAAVTLGPENVQNVPPQAVMYEYIVQPPPPPPPSTTMGAAASMQPPIQAMQPSMMMAQGTMSVPMQNPMQGPIQGPMQNPMQGPMQNPMQGPMPGQMQGHMPGQMQGPMPGQMQGHMPGQMQGPMQGTMPGSMQGPIPGPIQGPMPVHMPVPAPMPQMQPPPPPPPPSSSSTSMGIAGPVYSTTLPMQQNMGAVYHPAISQQPTLPPLFDPSRPPPPIPQTTTSRSVKRTGDECEAGPSKLRKSDSSNDSSCESCVQRQIRTELYIRQLEQIQMENEEASADLTNMMEDYEKKKQLLKSVTSADMFRRIEDFIENGSPSPLSDWNDTGSSDLFTSPLASASNANNNMVQQLAELLLGNNTREVLETVPTPPASDDTQLQVLSSLLDLLKKGPTERPAGGISEELSRSASSSASNGFNRFLNEAASPPVASRGRPYSDNHPSAGTTRPFSDVGAGPSNMYAMQRGYNLSPVPTNSSRPYTESGGNPAVTRNYSDIAGPPNSHPYGEPGHGGAHLYPENVARPYADAAGPPRYPPHMQAPPRQYHPGVFEGANAPPNAPSHAAPPLYMPGAYSSPAQPPPVRSFYGQFPPNNVQNPPYPGVVMSQPRPSLPPQNFQNNPYFMGGRYPNQHYYPPYQ